MNYYPHHIGDFNNATRHLTRVERALYRELLELYYDTETPLPADDFQWICKKVLASSESEIQSIEVLLSEFFHLKNDRWHQDRCDAEIAAYRAKHAGAIKAGKASAAIRSNAKATKRQRTLNERSTNAQRKSNQPEPITNNQNQEVKEKDIPPTAVVPTPDEKSTEPEPDPIFGHGLAFLKAKGCAEKGARSFLGLIRKTAGDALVAELLERAEREDVSEPIGWLRKAVEARKSGNGVNGHDLPPAMKWWQSDSGTDAKARELGITPRGGETYPQLRERIVAKLREAQHA